MFAPGFSTTLQNRANGLAVAFARAHYRCPDQSTNSSGLTIELVALAIDLMLTQPVPGLETLAAAVALEGQSRRFRGAREFFFHRNFSPHHDFEKAMSESSASAEPTIAPLLNASIASRLPPREFRET
jgi:hypothetical protein